MVDDEKDFLDILEMFLTSLEMKVSTASDGLMALEVAKNGNFDIIISDVRMPKSNGIEFLTQLKALNLKPFPHFFFSATSENSIVEMKKMGADGVIPKPFDLTELAKSISNHLKT